MAGIPQKKGTDFTLAISGNWFGCHGRFYGYVNKYKEEADARKAAARVAKKQESGD